MYMAMECKSCCCSICVGVWVCVQLMEMTSFHCKLLLYLLLFPTKQPFDFTAVAIGEKDHMNYLSMAILLPVAENSVRMKP